MNGDIGFDIRDVTEDVECLRSLLHLTVIPYDLRTLPPHYNRQYLFRDVIAEEVYKQF